MVDFLRGKHTGIRKIAPEGYGSLFLCDRASLGIAAQPKGARYSKYASPRTIRKRQIAPVAATVADARRVRIIGKPTHALPLQSRQRQCGTFSRPLGTA
jgi:hypothetical protein